MVSPLLIQDDYLPVTYAAGFRQLLRESAGATERLPVGDETLYSGIKRKSDGDMEIQDACLLLQE